jgi:hypothetical protein
MSLTSKACEHEQSGLIFRAQALQGSEDAFANARALERLVHLNLVA